VSELWGDEGATREHGNLAVRTMWCEAGWRGVCAFDADI